MMLMTITSINVIIIAVAVVVCVEFPISLKGTNKVYNGHSLSGHSQERPSYLIRP